MLQTDKKSIQQNQLTLKAIQPLSFIFREIPSEWSMVYVWSCPPKLRDGLSRLFQENWRKNDSDYPLSPEKSLRKAIAVRFPEFVTSLNHVFDPDPTKRPPYWLISRERLPSSVLLSIIYLWAQANDPNGMADRYLNGWQEIEVEWQQIDLREAQESVIEQTLPTIIFKWLSGQGWAFQVKSEKVKGQFPPHFVDYNGDPNLISSPIRPKEKTHPCHSVVMEVHSFMKEPDGHWKLEFDFRNRRWIPLSRTTPFNKRDSRHVFVWKDNRPLFSLPIYRQGSLHWKGKIPKVLSEMTPMVPSDAESIFDDSSPFQYWVPYQQRLDKEHLIHSGLEALDWKLWYEDLISYLPEEVQAERSYPQLYGSRGGPRRKQSKADSEVEKKRKAFQAIAPLKWEIWTDNKELAQELVQTLSEETGQDETDLDVCIRTDPYLIAPLQEREKGPDRLNYVRESLLSLKKNEKGAVLVLLKENYAGSEIDPKEWVRDGINEAGWVSKFMTVDDIPDITQNQKEKVIKNTVRSLLERMGFRLDTLYSQYPKLNHLPDQLQILSWDILQKNRGGNRSKNTIRFPVFVQTCSWETSWGFHIPHHDVMTEKPDVLVAIRNQSVQMSQDACRNRLLKFLNDGLFDWYETLLMVPESSVFPNVFPELQLEHLTYQNGALTWSSKPQWLSDKMRVVVIRERPARVFAYYSDKYYTGVYQHGRYTNVFQSVQKKPDSHQTKKGISFWDRWNKNSFNQQPLEFILLNVPEHEKPSDWAYVIHKLRQESSHTEQATTLPEPMYTTRLVKDYL